MKQEGKDETGSGTDPTLGKMSPKASNNSKKRYLIITYVAEFDRYNMLRVKVLKIVP